jgi:uncharacterized protein (DUF885 family)
MSLSAPCLWALCACGVPEPPPAAPPPTTAAPHEALGHLVERYWEESAAARPWYSWGGAEARYGEAPADTVSPQGLADSLALERRYLDDLKGVARAPLDADAKLTFDIFRRERELTIEGFTFPAELLPVNAYDSMPQRFALMAAAAETHALASERDFEVWQSRVRAYDRWTDQAIQNLREGMRRGYTLPLPVVSRSLPVLANLGEDAPTSLFYEALRPAAGDADDADRARLTLAITQVVKDRILPCYRRLHDFMQRDYLPRARSTVGMSALPLGQAWYAYLAKRATDGTQTPAELHAQGVAAVDRMHSRLQAVLAETAFPGDARGFEDSLRNDPRYSYKSADDLLNAYEELKTPVADAVTSLFPAAPHAEVQVRSVESFRMATAPALSYRRAMASGRYPAVLYVDTGGFPTRPAFALLPLYLREAVPGHHFQLALQEERADLPRFRRFGGAPAFIAGWGLYAASLGEELGLYREPAARFGALLAELTCAAGVVIDTGLHAQNWSRAQALDYLRQKVPLDEMAAANLVDRDLALPGEALSCLAGFSKLESLRLRAQQALGARFDEQAFHAELLRNGALPLDLLDAEVQRWVEVTAAEPAAAPPAVEPAPKLE